MTAPNDTENEKPRAKRFNRIRVFYRLYRKRLIAGFIIVAHTAGALTSVEAVMETRTPPGAVAWVLSLNLFPYAAVPAYWVFGHTEFKGYVVARRSEIETFLPTREKATAALNERALRKKSVSERDMTLQALADLPITTGNRAELLIDGEATFASMLEAIDNAQSYILLQSYIFRSDGIGTEFKNKLLSKAAAGLAVYVLYDEIGSLGLDESFCDELADGGVKIFSFTTNQRDGRKYQLNFRNHRKILVVDGKVGFAGGLNIGDDYLGKDPELSPFRDTHMKVTGPAAIMLQVPFVEDWFWVSGKIPEELNWTPEAAEGGDTSVLCLPTGPADERETCSLFFLTAINSAKKRLWISTPYFVPDIQIISALKLAALRGVDVRIIIPGLNDSKMVEYSSLSYVDDIAHTGIRVFRYDKGFTHQKVMLVDDDYSSVGSANLDNRSFRLNFEVIMGIDGAEFAGKMEKMFEEDFSNSTELDSNTFAKKSFLFRLLARVSRLLAPIQ